ncbi:hypothetical protein V5799_027840 [Amblyomma americanum]|uniref:Uncharacterized protein n=1 Tax=Amblyomma americanum TaxID=6943 RepID=A0AAQ4DEK4_AMBAM
MFRPVIMLALKPTTQKHVDDIPRLKHDFGATSGTPASFGNSWEAFKRKIQHSGRLSGLGGTDRRTMLNCVLFVLQVFLAVGSPGDGIFPPPSGRYTLPTSTGHAAMFRPVIMLALKLTTQKHVDDIPRLEHDFGATSGTPASSGTSWEAFKRKIQHSGRLSGLGGTDRRTMLNCVLFALQVFLAVGSPGDGIFPPPSGRYTLPTSTGPAAMFRPVIMLALKPTTQRHVDDIPRLEHDFGATSGTPASSGTSWEAFKRKIQHSGRLSGLGGTDRRTMLNCVLFVLQVSDKWCNVKSVKSNCVGLVVLPSPQSLLCCCCKMLCVAKLLLKLSGDLKENPGPDKLDEIHAMVSEIRASQILYKMDCIVWSVG